MLHLVPYYPPQRLGGVGVFVAGLHEGLREAGHSSCVITTGVGSDGGVERISVRPLAWFCKTALWAAKAARYDVVHCQGGEALPLLLLLALRGRRRPKILTTFHVDYRGMGGALRPYSIEGRRFARSWRPLLYRTVVAGIHRLLDRVARRLSDGVNAISVQSARDAFGTADNARVVYYGVAEPDLRATATGPAHEQVEILYCGAGGHRKRVVALPFVLRHVREQMPEARMRIAGFTPESEPEVSRLLAEMGLLPAVDFVGVKRPDELPPCYASAGVLVVPSAYEGLPLVILEAMRCGLPVVATRVSGHPEAIEDGVNGFLVDLDDPRQMAERCVEVLRDPGLRQRMSGAARRTVAERFSMERMRREYLEIYRRLTAPVPTSP